MRFLLPLVFLAACESRYPVGIGREAFVEEYAALQCGWEQECSGEEFACDAWEDLTATTFGENRCPDWDAAAAAACIDSLDAETCDLRADSEICTAVCQ